jgi:hypothetical protein
VKAQAGPCPFLSDPFLPEQRIDQACSDALVAVDLMPQEPAPIRIDRFVEKHFGITIQYDDLQTRFGEGVMGACRFNRDGTVAEIIVEVTLGEDDSKIAGKRVRSTMAHEGGHGLFHGNLFAEVFRAEDDLKSGLVKVDRCAGVTSDGFACRTIGEGGGGRRYDWWEVQANKAIGALLLPRRLVDPFVREIMATPLPRLAWTGKRPAWALKDVAGMVAAGGDWRLRRSARGPDRGAPVWVLWAAGRRRRSQRLGARQVRAALRRGRLVPT